MWLRHCPLLFACTWSIASLASAAAPSVESVSPGVGQRGTEFQLKLVGAGLSDAAEVMLYSSGVKCETPRPASDNELSLRLQVAADCPLGTHAFRIRTSKGISELRTFRVTPFPVVVAAEPNETFADAQLLSANVTVAGVLESGDVDCFQIPLRRGDRLSAEVEAVRLGGSLLDTVLTILGPDGKPIVTVDDTALFGQDPFVTFVAAADGPYVVQVRETNFEGDENSRYALHIGSFPRPAFVFPAGGPAGQKIHIRWGGDAAGSWEQEIQLPSPPVGDFSHFPEQQGLGAPTSNPFRVSPFDNVLEAEPNDSPSNIRGATHLPIAFNGILERAGDVDCFRFELETGAPFQFEAFAARIGAPVDTVLSILDERGNVLASNDDDETHDSRLTFIAPQSGQYALRVTDKRGDGGEGCVYRVEASHPRPGLSAFLPRPNRISQERQSIVVPRGNRVMAMLAVQRQGTDCDVDLRFEGLPTGASASVTPIPSDRYSMPVVLEASSDAPLGGALANVLVSGSAGDQRVTGRFIQVVDLVAGSADALFHSTTVNRLAVAVVVDAPFKISLEQPKAALAPDGTIGLQVRVDRAGDFEGPVDISFPFLPAWIDGPAKITIPADQTSAVYPARAFSQAEPRTWQLCAEAKPGTSSVNSAPAEPMPGAPMYRRRRPRSAAALDVAVSSQLVPLQVSAAPVTGSFSVLAAEPGKTVRLVCELNRTGELPQMLTAALEGLPNRVQASPVAVSRDDRSVTFAVTLEPTAPLGAFQDLVCRLSGVIDGQEVSYCVGRGGLLTIKPAGTLVTDEAGRALSPLEALRRSQQATNANP